MKSQDDSKSQSHSQSFDLQKHASEKALEGYCAFHHLLLAVAAAYPCVISYARKKVLDFIGSERNRRKDCVPDLGRFIILLSICGPDLSWSDIVRVFLRESFARNSRWIIKVFNARWFIVFTYTTIRLSY